MFSRLRVCIPTTTNPFDPYPLLSATTRHPASPVVRSHLDAISMASFASCPAARIALWTRHSRAAAGAGALALERSIRVGFTDPAAILTNGALHGACYRAGLFFHSTNRITLRRFVRSSACMTSVLSCTANRRSTVRDASRGYSPKMRLASSTARMSVSWSGLFLAGIQAQAGGVRSGGPMVILPIRVKYTLDVAV